MSHSGDHKHPVSRFLTSVWAPWVNILLMTGLVVTAVIFHPDHPITPIVSIFGPITVLGLGTQVFAHYRRRKQELRRSSAN